MKWYIVIFSSTDYYTMYEGYEIVKGKSPVEAKDKAIKIKYNGDLPSYCNVESIICTGNTKPVE